VDTDLDMVFALGKGGQLVALFPSRELVIVMTSDGYGESLNPLRLVQAACNSD
jgi:hypothetical protein